MRALCLSILLAALLGACSKPSPEAVDTEVKGPRKATLTLAGGEEVKGTIQHQTDEEIVIVTADGKVRALPMKDVLFVQVEGETKVASAEPAKQATLRTAEKLEKFQPPADGVISVAAGTELAFAANQRISSESAFPHQVTTAEVSHEIPGTPTGIPDGAVATLEILSISTKAAGEITIGLNAVNINGRRYRPAGGKPLELGALEPEVIGGRKTVMVSTGTVIAWKLKAALQLKEEK